GGPISSGTAGAPLFIEVIAQDSVNNTVTSFTGSVTISSTGSLSAGGGTAGPFVKGVLSSSSVTFSNTGTFTITATNTDGIETGTSESFDIVPGAAAAVRVETAADGSGTVVPAQSVPAGSSITVY